MIILVFIFVCLGVIFKVLEIFKWYILLLIVLFSIYLIKTAIKESKNKNRLSIFAKRKKVTYTDLLEPQILNLKEKKLYKRFDDMFLLVNSSGVYLIFVSDYDYDISETKNPKFLLQKDGNHKKIVFNILNKIKTYSSIVPLKNTYLIVKDHCRFRVHTEVNVLPFSKFYYKFMNFYDKYSDEEIENLFNKYCQLLSKKS